MLFRILFLIFSAVINAEETTCPQGSLNSGWTVLKSNAFSDPLKCCGNDVSQWSIAEAVDLSLAETGCLMEIRLASSTVLKQIYPLLCSSDSDCGETASDGSRMECCPEKYCLAASSNGSSLCHANFQNNEVTTFHKPRTDVEEMKHQCRKQGLNSCLYCSDNCASGSQVFEDDDLFRKKRDIPGSVTDAVSIGNPAPGANDVNLIHGNSAVTSPPLPDLPSAPPFEVPWTRNEVKRDTKGISISAGKVVPPFIAATGGTSPINLGSSSGSVPSSNSEDSYSGGSHNGNYNQGSGNDNYNGNNYGNEGTGYNTVNSGPNTNNVEATGYNINNNENTGYSNNNNNNEYVSQDEYGSNSEDGTGAYNTNYSNSNPPPKPTINIAPQGQPHQPEYVTDSSPHYNNHGNNPIGATDSVDGPGKGEHVVPYEGKDSNGYYSGQNSGYNKPASNSGYNTGSDSTAYSTTSRPRKNNY